MTTTPGRASRRELLADAGRVAALLGAAAQAGLLPNLAFAQAAAPYHADAFDAKTIAAAMKALGSALPQPSAGVSIRADDIAENGASVPVAVATTLPNVKRLLVLVDRNPAALSAMFEVSDAVEPAFAVRLKLAESTDIYAVAITADGRGHYAKKNVRVTLGGCGT